MNGKDLLKLVLYAGPVASLVHSQCRKMGLVPALPLVGLIVGIVLEMHRS